MHRCYEQQYQEMKQRLKGCYRLARDPLWALLQAVAIAKQYRDRLPLPGAHLSQIEYFKEHWPRFEAEVQYYQLRYEAERCRPDDSDRRWAGFWLKEMSRMTRLGKMHPDLYAYYRAGRTDRDEEYFAGAPTDAEKNAALWASFLALARYEAELEKKFIQLLEA